MPAGPIPQSVSLLLVPALPSAACLSASRPICPFPLFIGLFILCLPSTIQPAELVFPRTPQRVPCAAGPACLCPTGRPIHCVVPHCDLLPQSAFHPLPPPKHWETLSVPLDAPRSTASTSLLRRSTCAATCAATEPAAPFAVTIAVAPLAGSRRPSLCFVTRLALCGRVRQSGPGTDGRRAPGARVF